MSAWGNDQDGTPLFSGPRRAKRKPGTLALAGSVLVHSLVFAPALIAGLGPKPEPPAYKVYKVKIKSPPPAELGEPAPAPAAAAPPAVVEPPKPKPPEPKPAPKKPEPKPEAPVKASPKTNEPKTSTPAPAKEATPSRGPNPQAGSPGGENLDVDLEGEDFPDPAYLQNVIRQINRFFRWDGQSDLEVHIAFTINRNGSVSNLRVVRTSRNARFNFAAIQAVEEAGKRGLFGTLPKVWPRDALPVMFKFQPPK